VDGHTILAPDYVRECVCALQRSKAENVGGRMKPVGKNTFGKAVAMATSSPFGIGGGRFHYSTQEEWVDTVYLGAWPKEVFQKVGLFDEELVRDQDDEFNYRLREAGGKILLLVFSARPSQGPLESILSIWLMEGARFSEASQANALEPVYTPRFRPGAVDFSSISIHF